MSQQLGYNPKDLWHHSLAVPSELHTYTDSNIATVKILKIGTPKIITVIVIQMEQLDFTVQYCIQKMQTE